MQVVLIIAYDIFDCKRVFSSLLYSAANFAAKTEGVAAVQCPQTIRRNDTELMAGPPVRMKGLTLEKQ